MIIDGKVQRARRDISPQFLCNIWSEWIHQNDTSDGVLERRAARCVLQNRRWTRSKHSSSHINTVIHGLKFKPTDLWSDRVQCCHTFSGQIPKAKMASESKTGDKKIRRRWIVFLAKLRRGQRDLNLPLVSSSRPQSVCRSLFPSVSRVKSYCLLRSCRDLMQYFSLPPWLSLFPL